MKGILILGRSKDFFARVDIAPFCDYTFPCKSVRWTVSLPLGRPEKIPVAGISLSPSVIR
jgi:hypothetical protein